MLFLYNTKAPLLPHSLFYYTNLHLQKCTLAPALSESDKTMPKPPNKIRSGVMMYTKKGDQVFLTAQAVNFSIYLMISMLPFGSSFSLH